MFRAEAATLVVIGAQARATPAVQLICSRSGPQSSTSTAPVVVEPFGHLVQLAAPDLNYWFGGHPAEQTLLQARDVLDDLMPSTPSDTGTDA
jgi:hypothetical protein